LPPCPRSSPSSSPRQPLDGLDQIYPQLDALYVDLHKSPELSMKEQRTSARMAEELRKLGYEVTTGVGGTGVVGVLRNGKGPTVLLRTELDALPIEEKTGLPFASTRHGREPGGTDGAGDARLRSRRPHGRVDGRGGPAGAPEGELARDRADDRAAGEEPCRERGR